MDDTTIKDRTIWMTQPSSTGQYGWHRHQRQDNMDDTDIKDRTIKMTQPSKTGQYGWHNHQVQDNMDDTTIKDRTIWMTQTSKTGQYGWHNHQVQDNMVTQPSRTGQYECNKHQVQDNMTPPRIDLYYSIFMYIYIYKSKSLNWRYSLQCISAILKWRSQGTYYRVIYWLNNTRPLWCMCVYIYVHKQYISLTIYHCYYPGLYIVYQVH